MMASTAWTILSVRITLTMVDSGALVSLVLDLEIPYASIYFAVSGEN